MATERTLCRHCGRMTLTSFGICAHCGEAKDERKHSGPVSARPDVWRSVWDDLDVVFWFVVVAALALLAVAVFVVGSIVLALVAAALLAAPVTVKLFNNDWW